METLALAPALKHDVELAVEAAIFAQPRAGRVVIAKSVYDSEPELMKMIHRTATMRYLMWIADRKRANIPVDEQLALPGMPQFPIRMTLKDGSHPRFMSATLKQLREFREILLKRKPPSLRVVDRMIEVMEPYAKLNRDIPVASVLLAEHAKAANEQPNFL